MRRFEGHHNRAHSCGLAFSPCAKYFATGAEDRSVSTDNSFSLGLSTSALWCNLCSKHFLLSCAMEYKVTKYHNVLVSYRFQKKKKKGMSVSVL